MQKVVGVAFNKKGRVYNFNANNHDLNIGDTVIVETEKGYQYASCRNTGCHQPHG